MLTSPLFDGNNVKVRTLMLRGVEGNVSATIAEDNEGPDDDDNDNSEWCQDEDEEDDGDECS